MTDRISIRNEKAPETFRLGLRNLSGVPVLDVAGDINRMTVRAIEETASRLVRAGHYHLVVNIQKAPATNARTLRPLSRLAREARKHYGGVALVAGLGWAGHSLSSEFRKLFFLCASETDALLKIKRLAHVSDTDREGTRARLAE